MKDLLIEKTDTKTRHCLACGKEFFVLGFGNHLEKKFCSAVCRTRANAKRRYELLKNNIEYKNKKKEYFKRWIKENREHFNNLMREPNRIRNFKRYHHFDKLGLCPTCGKKRDRPNCKHCEKCTILKR